MCLFFTLCLIIALAITYGVVAGLVWIICEMFGFVFSHTITALIWLTLMYTIGKVKKRGSE